MKLLEDQHGTAFLEALLAIPAIAVVLSGIVALSSMYSAKLEAKSRGRRLAWLQADSGDCPERTCMHDDCKAFEEQLESSGAGGLESVRAGKLSLGSFLGDVRDFFIGRVTRGDGMAHASLPRVLGAGRSRQQGATVLLCNTTSRSVSGDGSILDYACATGLGATEYAREVCE